MSVEADFEWGKILREDAYTYWLFSDTPVVLSVHAGPDVRRSS